MKTAFYFVIAAIGLMGEVFVIAMMTFALAAVLASGCGALSDEPRPDPEVISLGTPAEEEATGLSMDAQVKLVYFSGFALEEVIGKLVCRQGSFSAAFCRQCGVQLQVAAMDKAGMIAGDPLTAAFQGFLIGL